MGRNGVSFRRGEWAFVFQLHLCQILCAVGQRILGSATMQKSFIVSLFIALKLTKLHKYAVYYIHTH
uniref:Uncharacterized protein n=1 Tax=Anguilla anguilla TaxID=7936 RepID=A0A0E9PX46_ANGAN